MDWRKKTSWLLRFRSRPNRQEPGAALFRGLRINLTLWYCGVLGAALLLFGVALYFGTQYFLLTPIESDAVAHAQVHKNDWLMNSPYRACPLLGPQGQFGMPPGPGFQMSELVACFDQNGSLLPDQNTTGLSPAYLTNTLGKMALQTGQPAYDIVNAGGTTGQIYRYALVIPSLTGGGNVGVVLI